MKQATCLLLSLMSSWLQAQTPVAKQQGSLFIQSVWKVTGLELLTGLLAKSSGLKELIGLHGGIEMHKFYEVQKGQVVKVKKYDRFSVSVETIPAKKMFFQGIDSLKALRAKGLHGVTFEPHAGINP